MKNFKLINENCQRISGNHKLGVKLPVLMYHGIVDTFNGKLEVGQSPYYITTSQFQSQMRYLHENRYRTVPLSQLIEMSNNNSTSDNGSWDKSIFITFDDGYQNNYIHAFPILKQYSFNATFFIIVSRIGSNNYLSWEQLKQMANEGMEIQSHTLNHNPLEILSLTDVEKELRLSKEILEQKLRKSVTIVSYPHGSYNKKIIELVKKSGYNASCTSEIKFLNCESNLFKIGRFDIRRDYDIEDFIKIVQKDPLFIRKIKLARMIKQLIQSSIGIKNYIKLYKKVRKIHRAQD